MAVFETLAQSAFLLKEAQRAEHSLPVRLRALSMTVYTLDLLFTRQAPLLQRAAQRDRMAADLLRALPEKADALLERASMIYLHSVVPDMTAQGFVISTIARCSPEQQATIARYFERSIRPLLTPLAVDAGRPFPQISTSSLNLLAIMQAPKTFDYETPYFARIKVPRTIPRLLEASAVEQVDGRAVHTFVLAEDAIHWHVEQIFPGMKVTSVHQFRILRAALHPDEAQPQQPAAYVRQKSWPVVRIDVEAGMPNGVVSWLQEQLDAPGAAVIRRASPLALGALTRECAERVVHYAYRPYELYE
jgi:polyphosphate kinase